MPGVYGEMLPAFAELLSEYEIFTMSALSGGGFGERKKVATVTGYLSRTQSSNAGFPDDTFNENEVAVFYAMETVPKGLVKMGMYVEDDNEIFKFTHDDVYVKEGGFSAYRLQMAVGPTDKQVPNEQVEDNIANDY